MNPPTHMIAIEVVATLLVDVQAACHEEARTVASAYADGFNDPDSKDDPRVKEWTIVNVKRGRPYLVVECEEDGKP